MPPRMMLHSSRTVMFEYAKIEYITHIHPLTLIHTHKPFCNYHRIKEKKKKTKI